MRRAVLAVVLAACGTPTPQLRLGFAEPPTQACPSTDCSQVQMLCDAVMSIRMVDPSDPSKTYFKQCVRVQPDKTHDMCSLKSVDLDPAPIPVRKLDVQVAIYPVNAVPFDPDNNPICPESIAYSVASGFPVEQAPAPALGGHKYYQPGDDVVEVVLGCTDLSAINATCSSSFAGSVTANIVDFDTRLPVTMGFQGVADRLWVSVGEPHLVDATYVLNPRDTVALHLEDEQSSRWTAPVALNFTKYACVEVLEDVAQTTASLQCVPTSAPLPELAGMRLARDTLENLVKSLGLDQVPDQGLTIGMVIDSLSNGVPGVVVSPSIGTVSYPSIPGEPSDNKTSRTGIFISRDAPFGTRFSVDSNRAVSTVGGLVAGKVTIAILPLVARPVQ